MKHSYPHKDKALTEMGQKQDVMGCLAIYGLMNMQHSLPGTHKGRY